MTVQVLIVDGAIHGIYREGVTVSAKAAAEQVQSDLLAQNPKRECTIQSWQVIDADVGLGDVSGRPDNADQQD